MRSARNAIKSNGAKQICMQMCAEPGRGKKRRERKIEREHKNVFAFVSRTGINRPNLKQNDNERERDGANGKKRN